MFWLSITISPIAAPEASGSAPDGIPGVSPAGPEVGGRIVAPGLIAPPVPLREPPPASSVLASAPARRAATAPVGVLSLAASRTPASAAAAFEAQRPERT